MLFRLLFRYIFLKKFKMERKIIKEKRGGKKLEWKGQAVSHSMRTFSRMPSDNPPRESPRSAVTDEESRGVGSPVCAIMAGGAPRRTRPGDGERLGGDGQSAGMAHAPPAPQPRRKG